jgi:choline dehydrogenase
VRHALPGVGENLRDHYVPRTRWLIGKKGITFNDRGRGLGLAQQVLHYALFRQGMLAMTGAPIRAFVCSREGLEARQSNTRVLLTRVPGSTQRVLCLGFMSRL